MRSGCAVTRIVPGIGCAESRLDRTDGRGYTISQNSDQGIGTMKTVPLSEAKAKLSDLIKQVAARDEQVTITRNGRPAAVLVSPDEFESWQETLAIRSDPELMKEIRRGLRALSRRRRPVTVDELFGKDK